MISLWDRQGDKRIQYSRGTFVEDDGSQSIHRQGIPFDDQARRDFTTITKTLKQAGVEVGDISLKYSGQGELVKGVFRLKRFGRHSYVYSPNYRALPEDEPREREHFVVDKDWYHIWSDLN